MGLCVLRQRAVADAFGRDGARVAPGDGCCGGGGRGKGEGEEGGWVEGGHFGLGLIWSWVDEMFLNRFVY